MHVAISMMAVFCILSGGDAFRYIMVPFPKYDAKYGLTERDFYRDSASWLSFQWHNTPEETIRTLRWKEEVTGKKTPVVFQIAHQEKEMSQIGSPEVRAFVAGLGTRFLGLQSLEGLWDPHKRWKSVKYPAAVNLPRPETKKDAWETIRRYYRAKVADPHYPVMPGSYSFVGHHTASWGAAAVVGYYGSNLLCGQIQSAFGRGAARQYDKPWAAFYATFGVYLMGKDFPEDGIRNMHVDNSLSYGAAASPDESAPDQRHLKNNIYTLTGPRCGADPETTMRQHLYTLCIAGVNMIQFESDSHRFRYARYREKSDGAVSAMPPGELAVSPALKVLDEVYEYSLRQERGNPVTPVALMLDWNHGYIWVGEDDTYFTFGKRSAADRQIPALINYLFPVEEYMKNLRLGYAAKRLRDVPAEQNCMVNLPFGNYFDVLTSDAPESVLRRYPVIVLAGSFDAGSSFGSRLAAYVAEGGTLVLSAPQCVGLLSEEESGVEEIAAPEHFRFGSILPLTLRTAEPVRKSDDGKVLLARQKYGKGVIYTGAEPYFMGKAPAGAQNRDRVTPSETFKILLNELLAKHVPVKIDRVSGSVDASVNDLADVWLVTLANYDGVTHNMGQKPVLDMSKTAQIRLTVSGGSVTGTDTITGIAEKTPLITIKPGEIKIIRILKKQQKGTELK